MAVRGCVGMGADAWLGTVRGEDWYARDLSGETFERIEFVDVDLTEAVATGATFADCAFRGVRFNASVWTETAFTACRFGRCGFFDARFERCKLVGSVFDDCTFDLLRVERGDWSFVNLRRAALGGARIEGARMREADLSGARARDAVLTGVDLSGAELVDVDLRGADLRGSDLSALDPRTAALDAAMVDDRQASVLAENLGLVVVPVSDGRP